MHFCEYQPYPWWILREIIGAIDLREKGHTTDFSIFFLVPDGFFFAKISNVWTHTAPRVNILFTWIRNMFLIDMGSFGWCTWRLSMCTQKAHFLAILAPQVPFFSKCATRVLIMFWDNTIVIFKNFRSHRTLFVPLMICYLSSKKSYVTLKKKMFFSCCLKS